MSATPRPMRAASARRRSATAAVSTGRPMPGNSGTGVQAPIAWTGGSGGGFERPCARAPAVHVTATTTNARGRMGPEATARDGTRQLDAASAADANYAMPSSSAVAAADSERLAARVAELERERTHLLAVIEILKEVSTSLHFIDILQAIARKLGEAFGLDRCAIFLRTFRDGPTFSDDDVRFVQVVASLTAQALRNAHRYERLAQRQQETGEAMRRMELERVALLSFLRRLLGAFGEREGAWAEGLLPRASAEELDRLVGVAMAVIQEEAKGR